MKGVQMYKIYINRTKVILKSSEAISKRDEHSETCRIFEYSGVSEDLLGIIELCESNPSYKRVIIHHHDFEALRCDFKSFYKTVKACGGLVVNENAEILMIYRRGSWDLPKGKMEKGESRKETAVREVMEETGIDGVEIVAPLKRTRHTYRDYYGVRCIKKSYWYLMKSHNQDLIPQTEEDIERAEWMPMEETEKLTDIYANIVAVLRKYKAQSK